MNKHLRIITLIAALILASLACLSTTPPESGDILFEDNFSDTNGGWDQYSDAEGFTDYVGDAYHIGINTDNYFYWANPSEDFTDVIVEVDTSLVGGGEDNFFGIICRYEDIDNFYVAAISSDGFYGFSKRINGGDLTGIGGEDMRPSEAINLGGSINHLRADCVGDSLTLYVNGEYVASVRDSDLTSGDVGLIAGTFSIPNTEVLFDNFVVRQP